MKFLCLCHYEPTRFAALSESDRQGLGDLCRPHDEALRASGRLVMVGSLAEPPAARTLRPGNGKPSVSDGPYAATEEPPGAFFIIEAEDMDEAIEVASKHPGVQLGRYFGGGIEVRPIEMLDQPRAPRERRLAGEECA